MSEGIVTVPFDSKMYLTLEDETEDLESCTCTDSNELCDWFAAVVDVRNRFNVVNVSHRRQSMYVPYTCYYTRYENATFIISRRTYYRGCLSSNTNTGTGRGRSTPVNLISGVVLFEFVPN